jgi:hypothetical protein
MVKYFFQKLMGAAKKEITCHDKKCNKGGFGAVPVYKPKQDGYKHGCAGIDQ